MLSASVELAINAPPWYLGAVVASPSTSAVTAVTNAQYQAVALDGTPVSINRLGQVALNQGPNIVLWDKGLYTTLGVGTAIEINNNGQVLGWNSTAGTMSIFKKGAATITYNVPSGYIPVDMNDKLEIIGNTARSPLSDYYTAWYFNNGQYTSIVVDPDTSFNRTAAYSINNNSQVTGTADFFTSGFDVFVWMPTANGGTISDRGNDNYAFDQAEGRAINDNGLIAGAGLSWADFIYQGLQVSGTTFTSLGAIDPSYDTIPTGINNFGDIVGDNITPFLYTGGTMYDLASLSPADVTFTDAPVFINDSGWIVAGGSVAGAGTGVLLKPTTGSLVNGQLRALGTAGNDHIIVTVSRGTLTLKVNGQIQRFAAADVNSLVIVAGGGNDTILLNPGVLAATVYGGGGNDTFISNNGGGNTFAGGVGDDTYRFALGATAANVILENQWEGSDTLDLSDLPASSPVIVNLLDDAALAITGTTLLATGSAANLENAVGTNGNDTFTLNSAANSVFGLAGNDTFRGVLDYAKDLVDGNGGTDTMIGDFDAFDGRKGVEVYLPGPNPALPPVTDAGWRGSFTVGKYMGTIIYQITRIFPRIGSGGWVTVDGVQYWGVMTASGGVTALTWYHGTDSTGPEAGHALLNPQPDGTLTGPIQFTSITGVITGTGTVLLRLY